MSYSSRDKKQQLRGLLEKMPRSGSFDSVDLANQISNLSNEIGHQQMEKSSLFVLKSDAAALDVKALKDVNKRQVYRYKNLTYSVSDDTEVLLTVEFISDGNSGQTIVNVPGPADIQISDSGTASIGNGSDLRTTQTICVSDIANLIPYETDIIIRYSLNGVLLLEHSNAKSEEERPLIILLIQFPQQ